MLGFFDLLGGALDDIDSVAGDFFPCAFLGAFISGEALFGSFIGVGGLDGFDVGGADDFFDGESAGRAVGEGWFVEGLYDGKSSGADLAWIVELFVFVLGHIPFSPTHTPPFIPPSSSLKGWIGGKMDLWILVSLTH